MDSDSSRDRHYISLFRIGRNKEGTYNNLLNNVKCLRSQYCSSGKFTNTKGMTFCQVPFSYQTRYQICENL